MTPKLVWRIAVPVSLGLAAVLWLGPLSGSRSVDAPVTERLESLNSQTANAASEQESILRQLEEPTTAEALVFGTRFNNQVVSLLPAEELSSWSDNAVADPARLASGRPLAFLNADEAFWRAQQVNAAATLLADVKNVELLSLEVGAATPIEAIPERMQAGAEIGLVSDNPDALISAIESVNNRADAIVTSASITDAEESEATTSADSAATDPQQRWTLVMEAQWIRLPDGVAASGE